MTAAVHPGVEIDSKLKLRNELAEMHIAKEPETHTAKVKKVNMKRLGL